MLIWGLRCSHAPSVRLGERVPPYASLSPCLWPSPALSLVVSLSLALVDSLLVSGSVSALQVSCCAPVDRNACAQSVHS